VGQFAVGVLVPVPVPKEEDIVVFVALPEMEEEAVIVGYGGWAVGVG